MIEVTIFKWRRRQIKGKQKDELKKKKKKEKEIIEGIK